jgi:hypothetical protein
MKESCPSVKVAHLDVDFGDIPAVGVQHDLEWLEFISSGGDFA